LFVLLQQCTWFITGMDQKRCWEPTVLTPAPQLKDGEICYDCDKRWWDLLWLWWTRAYRLQGIAQLKIKLLLRTSSCIIAPISPNPWQLLHFRCAPLRNLNSVTQIIISDTLCYIAECWCRVGTLTKESRFSVNYTENGMSVCLVRCMWCDLHRQSLSCTRSSNAYQVS
jgi:hypothetical protein